MKAWLIFAVLWLTACLISPVVRADDEAEITPGLHCSAPDHLLRLSRPLPRFSYKLSSGAPIKIVALGSSSTFGMGASSPAASYPSRLQAELRALYPQQEIAVVNRGVSGGVTREEMLRFDQDVMAEKPDLVIWQTGVNTLLLGQDMWSVFIDVRNGVRRLHALGADVVLMNMQYSPRVLARLNYPDMLELLSVTSRETHVGLFDRFAIMKSWAEREHGFDQFITADGLHMNDAGYACLAQLLAKTIHRSVKQQTSPR